MNVYVRFFTVTALAALAAGATPLAAQQTSPVENDEATAASAVVTPDSAAPRGPAIANARVASHVASAPIGAPPVIQNRSSNRNAVALMAVGGAALVVGAVIGDDAGTLVMLGGAVVGLYGLYLFLT